MATFAGYLAGYVQLTQFDPAKLPPNPVFEYGYPVATPKAAMEVTRLGSNPAIKNIPTDNIRARYNGYRLASYVEDFYNRIHIRPSQFNFGNMLSAQTREVEVWNAYFIFNTLSTIQQVGTEGVEFVGPHEPPTAFGPLESRVYTLNASTNGPAILDATYTFVFENETPSLRLTGRRVVVWPYIPEYNHTESWQWATNIIPSFRKEQRIALRIAPRQTLNYRFVINEEEFSKLRAMATQWAHRVYGVPVWSECVWLNDGVPLGANEIRFPTANADFRPNSVIGLWQSNGYAEAIEVTEVLADRVILKQPMDKAFGPCYVAPMRFARTMQGAKMTRSHNHNIIVDAEFTSTENTFIGADDSPIYRGAPLLLERPATISANNESIMRDIVTLENGTGVVHVDVNSNWVDIARSIAFTKGTRQEVFKLKQWIHSRIGKQRAFWLPSWNTDLVLAELITQLSNTIVVKPISYPLYYTVKDAIIFLTDGSFIPFRIFSGSTMENGMELLTCDTAFDRTILTEEVAYICFMDFVRFDSDTITMNHGSGTNANVSIPVRIAPES